MKKVLVLAYDFPPYNSIGGQRPYGWFKYLKEFGYEPIVVTRHWDNDIKNSIDYVKPSKNKSISKEKFENGIVYKAPFFANYRDKLIFKFGLEKYILLRKSLSFFYQIFEFVSFKFDNKSSLFFLAREVIKEHKIDYIIATGEPFILFKYASILSKQNNIPWIADYRDGWSTNYNRSKWEQLYYSKIEKKILSGASLVTASSMEFAEQLQKFLNKKVAVVLNGFFEEKFTNLDLSQKQSKFIVSFAGTLYPYQPIEIIAQGVSMFLSKERTDVLVRFIGVKFYPEQVARIKKAFGTMNTIIEFTERIPHDETIKLLNESSVLLLPASAGHPQIYAKVFDYLALRKNILLCQSDEGSLKQIISETHSGVICNSANEVAEAFEKMYVEWKSKGSVSCNSKNIEKYSRRNQTKVLAEILHGL